MAVMTNEHRCITSYNHILRIKWIINKYINNDNYIDKW